MHRYERLAHATTPTARRNMRSPHAGVSVHSASGSSPRRPRQAHGSPARCHHELAERTQCRQAASRHDAEREQRKIHASPPIASANSFALAACTLLYSRIHFKCKREQILKSARADPFSTSFSAATPIQPLSKLFGRFYVCMFILL
jgi:hypothetical protein